MKHTRLAVALGVALMAAPVAPTLGAGGDAASVVLTNDADQVASEGSVTIANTPVPYRAVAGTLVVHGKDWHGEAAGPSCVESPAAGQDAAPQAAMSYIAYFSKDTPSRERPLAFVFNGGPGSSTMWFHMGAFGPRRVVTGDDTHDSGPPYRIVNNDESLLDVSDLVFVDAPGTGFGCLSGKDAAKTFFGVDEDANAFANFIVAFMTRFGRWNSPRFLIGASYGTTRAAVLANILEENKGVDISGIVMMSQVLNFDLVADHATGNPGVDMPYVLGLPSYAATAFYHHRLPAGTSTELAQLLPEVERWATHDYLQALAQGSALDGTARRATAEKLSEYTGLSVAYLERSNLRVEAGAFLHELMADTGTTIGRLDTRFSGPTMDPLEEEASYDPQTAAIKSAYVSATNEYVRGTLQYGKDRSFKEQIPNLWSSWNWRHEAPNVNAPVPGQPNVMSDLAAAMEYNPSLKVQLESGYFDLATPFYQGIYELQHLPMPETLQANISYRQYRSGHMIAVHQDSLVELHDNIKRFINGRDKGREG